MADAYIVAAARTAGAKKGGRLAGWHPADMAGEILNNLVDRVGFAERATRAVPLPAVVRPEVGVRHEDMRADSAHHHWAGPPLLLFRAQRSAAPHTSP